MAKIPRIERRVSPNVDKFQGMQADTQVSQATAQLGGQLQQAGQVLQQIQDKANQITDVRQSNEARLKLQKATNEFKVSHKENTDPATWDKDYEDYRKNVDNIVGSVNNKRIADKISYEADNTYQAMWATSKISDIDRERKMSQDAVNVSAQSYVDIYANSNDPSIWGQSKQTFINSLYDQAKLEGYSKEWVAQQIDKYDRVAHKNKVLNIAETDADKAMQHLEDFSYLYDQEEKARLVKSISDVKTYEELKYEKEYNKAKVNSVVQLQTLFENDQLNLATLESMKQQNPMIEEFGLDKKYEAIITNKNRLEGNLNPAIYNDLVKQYYDILGNQKAEKISGKKIEKLFEVASNFAEAQIRGEVSGEEGMAFNKLLTAALDENPKYIKKFPYMRETINNVSTWASVTSNNLKSKGFVVDESEIINQVISAISPEDSLEVIDQKISQAITYQNRALAKQRTTIVTNGKKDFAKFGDSYYEVKEYTYGEPIISFTEVDESFTKVKPNNG